MIIVSIITPIVLVLMPLLTIIFNKWVSKVFSLRSFNIIVGILLFLIFIGFRYIWYIFDYIQFFNYHEVPNNLLLTSSFVNESSDNYNLISSTIYANLMFLNLNDMITLLLSFSMIFFNNKAFTKVISVIGMLLLVWINIFSNIHNWNDINYGYLKDVQPWKYLIVSDGLQRFPLILNALTILFCSGSMVATKEFSRWSILSSFIVVSIIIGHIIILSTQYNININASGFSVYGWHQYAFNNFNIAYIGPYEVFDNVSNNKIWININVLRSINAAIWFGWIIVTVIFKNALTSSIFKINYIFKPWYANNKLFRSTFYYIDATINNFLWKYILHSNYLSAGTKFGLASQLKMIFDSKTNFYINAQLLNEYGNKTGLVFNVNDIIKRTKAIEQNLELFYGYKDLDKGINNNVEQNKKKELYDSYYFYKKNKDRKQNKKKYEQNILDDYNNQLNENDQQVNLDTKIIDENQQVARKVNEPFLENGKWWYIDDNGNKYYANNNQEWILVNN